MSLASPLVEALRDRYVLERELGRGGMATVYLARDLKHDRLIALKVLHPELAATLGPERFQREIKLAARLQHPHILPVHDSGETAGQLWYTMPYVEGESLRDLLRRKTQLSIEEALKITREMADALECAHSQGIVHRDVKPENILLSRGHALMADFGVASALGEAGGEKLTGTGMALGTPSYMSPEQASGSLVDARSDIYALGCVLYEMLAGEPPFTGPTPQAVIAKRFVGPVPSVRVTRPDVAVALDAVITRALAPVPAARYNTAGEFAHALADRSATQPPTVRSAAPFHRHLPLVASALIAIALALLLLQRWSIRSPAETSPSPIAFRGPLIAVLPFQTIGADTSQRYFTAGMTEEITAQLSKIVALRVVSSEVTAAYRGSTDRLPRMARELGVRSVVLGSVRLAGSRVRIDVQLADARTGQGLWSDQYDRSLASIFEVQSDVAHRIAEALQAKLTPAEAQRIERPLTADPLAHDRYLRSFELNSVDPIEAKAGIDLLRQAIRLDSTFAEARAELGRRFLFLSVYGDPAYSDSALTTVRQALAMQPDLPNAYAILGDIQSNAGHLSTARQSYKKALALNPSNVIAMADLSNDEIILGRPDEGLRWAVRAAPLGGNNAVMYYHVAAALLQLDQDEVVEAWLKAGERQSPTNFSRIEVLLSVVDLLRGRDDAAMQRARRVIAREPGDEEAQAYLAELATILRASDAEQLVASLSRRNPTARSGWRLPESFRALHALALQRRGQRARADSLWNEALAADRRDLDQEHENPDRFLETAAIWAIRGDTATALDWLERGYRAGWRDARTLMRDPFFEPLRAVPRFQDLLARMAADVAIMRTGVKATTDSLLKVSRGSDPVEGPPVGR